MLVACAVDNFILTTAFFAANPSHPGVSSAEEAPDPAEITEEEDKTIRQHMSAMILQNADDEGGEDSNC